MNSFVNFLGLVAILLILCSCEPHTSLEIQKTNQEFATTNKFNKPFPTDYNDTTYVAIYSDIYSKSRDISFLLTGTLSIRNTSLSDSIFLSQVAYYDSEGHLVNNQLESPIFVPPMATIEYVIDEKDKGGGTGANFLIYWSARHLDVRPIFEGVMISTAGQQGISFTTQGVSIARR